MRIGRGVIVTIVVIFLICLLIALLGVFAMRG